MKILAGWPPRYRRTAIVAAVAVLLGGGWLGVDTWRGRHAVNAACADLAPAGDVLDLSVAGGAISGRDSEEGTIELGAEMPQDCELFSTEAGELTGSSSGERWFFTGQVAIEPNDWEYEADDSFDDVLRHRGYGAPHYPEQPLGGGISGSVGSSRVRVRMPCPEGRYQGKPIATVIGNAVLNVAAEPEYSEDGQANQEDRDALARIAVGMANNLAERVGCADRLPDPPQDIPALTATPIPAERAAGTCAWYKGVDRSAGLPGKVVESRADDRAWEERCLLAAEPAIIDGRQERPWVGLASFFGQPARNTRLEGIGDPPPIEAGTAGFEGDGANAFWATSVCGGQPAVHTMTLSHPYTKATAEGSATIFRSYVTALAIRRHCTRLKLPEPDAYARATTEAAH